MFFSIWDTFTLNAHLIDTIFQNSFIKAKWASKSTYIKAGNGGTHLESQHVGGRGNGIVCSRPACAVRPCPKRKENVYKTYKCSRWYRKLSICTPRKNKGIL